MANTTYDVRARLQKAMEIIADELKAHGADSLYNDGEQVTDGSIRISFDSNLVPTITYEKDVFPLKADMMDDYFKN